MKATIIFRVTVSLIRNLIAELPRQMSAALRRFSIPPTQAACTTTNARRHNGADGADEVTGENDNIESATSKLLGDLILFKEFASSRIDETPREKRAAILRRYDFLQRVKSAATEIKRKRKSLIDNRLDLEKFVTKGNAEIKINRSVAMGASVISSKASYVSSAREGICGKETKVTALKAEVALFGETSAQMKTIIGSRQDDLKKSRLSAERRCLAAAKNYDREIGARHRLLEELRRENDNLKEEQKSAEERALEQAILYGRLKEEREIRLIADFAQRLENFRRNRAANIIQIAWRAYYQRSCAKKRRKTKRK